MSQRTYAPIGTSAIPSHTETSSAAGSVIDALSPNLDQNSDPSAYEAHHVHAVYERIAPHFSATRYKPWPMVSRFLSNQTPGCVGLDVGCGNGKYFAVNPAVYLIGSDHSAELTTIAHTRASSSTSGDGPVLYADVCVADGLALPHPRGRADFVISVAVVHHFATRERRVSAVAALLAVVREDPMADLKKAPESGDAAAPTIVRGGSVLITAWALEQRGSRRGWDRGMEQDVLVPWVMKGSRNENNGQSSAQTFQRFYHLYHEGELEEDVRAAGGIVLESGYEADNWWVIAARPSQPGE